ncbi:MAG: PAS domain S-box protein [Methanobacteriaceae archaeon]|nr:PAS domain S-box protein [Methanobacteriaceae archaeon]
MANIKILLIYDDRIDLMDIMHDLESFNYEVLFVSSGSEELINKIGNIKPDLILMDIFLKEDMDGIEVAYNIKELDIPVIFLTDQVEESVMEKALETDPYGFLIKPVDKTKLKFTIDRALLKRKMDIKNSKQISLIKAINRILKESITCESAQDVAKICLNVAEELTLSKFGFIGELNSSGSFDTLAISDPGWDECIMPDTRVVKLISDMKIRGYWARAIKNDESVIVNDPVSDPERLGEPEGHPRITSFLGVPLKQEGKTVGMIALANKESGYNKEDQNAIETLSFTILEALNRKKSEITLQRNEERFRAVAESAIDAIVTTDVDGKIKFFNKSLQKIFGYSPDELTGSPLTILMPERNKNDYLQELKRFKKSGKHRLVGRVVETIGLKKDGTEFPFEMSLASWKSGKKTFFTSIIRDLTEKKAAEEKLKWSDKRLQMGMEMAKLVYWEYDIENDLFTFDDKFYSLYGTSAKKEGGNQMSSQEYAERFIPPEEQDLVGIEVSKALETEDPDYSSTLQHSIIRADGERRTIIVRIKIKTDENGKKIGTIGVNQDITELKKAEEALKESDQLLSDIINFLPDATFTIDAEGKVISWNRAIEEMTGIWAEEILGKGNYEYSLPFYGERRPMLIDMVNASEDEINKYYPKLKRKGNILTAETDVSLNRNIETVWALAVPLYDSKDNFKGAIEAIRDITKMKESQRKIERELKEKEMLLKEIHHRAKNNLMIISSLLNLQSSYLKDKESQDIFIESQKRARSMAIIHERLYRSTDLKKIDFRDYIQSLATELFHTYVDDPSRLQLKINVDNIFLDVNTAIPLGLIINELVTNSLKYAFPNGKSGEIDIDFHKKDDYYEFTIKDNGIGFPEDLDFHKTDSLGMQLVNSFTDQIDGKIELDRRNGTKFKIIFKEPVF